MAWRCWVENSVSIFLIVTVPHLEDVVQGVGVREVMVAIMTDQTEVVAAEEVIDMAERRMIIRTVMGIGKLDECDAS